MESVREFIADLSRAQVTLWLEGEQLRYRVPSGALSVEKIEEIKRRKSEITAFLKSMRQARHDNEPQLVERGTEGLLPTSFTQEVLVKAYEQYTNPLTANMVVAKRLTGPLETPILEKSLCALMSRHSILRAHYVRAPDGGVWTKIDPASELQCQVIQLDGCEPSVREEQARVLVAQARKERFDLTAGSLLRAKLIELSTDDKVLILAIHHSVCDALSVAVLVRDLIAFYTAFKSGDLPRLPSLPVQYTDYARWFREWMESDVGREHLQFWKDRLKGVSQAFRLPSDQIETQASAPERYADGFKLPSAVVEQLRRAAQREGATVPLVLLSIFTIVLSRWGKSDDICVGVLHLGRLRPEVWDLVGCFMQAWMLRVPLGHDYSLLDVVRLVRDANVDALDHMQVPFWRMKELLVPNSEEKPLLHVTFNYVPALPATNGSLLPSSPLRMQDFQGAAQSDPLDEVTGQKLVIYFFEVEDGISGIVRYSRERFAGATIDSFWDNFKELLEIATSTSNAAEILPRLTLHGERW